MNNNYDDIDLKKYKANFFAALKTPPVVMSLIMAVIGIILTIASSLGSTQRMTYIIAIAGCIVTMTACEMININIRKVMGSGKQKKE